MGPVHVHQEIYSWFGRYAAPSKPLTRENVEGSDERSVLVGTVLRAGVPDGTTGLLLHLCVKGRMEDDTGCHLPSEGRGTDVWVELYAVRESFQKHDS